MQTIKLHIEDSKVDTILNIINSLKSNIVSSYEIVNDTEEEKDLQKLSEPELHKVWDNKEDSVYDKFL